MDSKVKRLKTRSYTLYSNEIRRLTNIADRLSDGHIEEHGGSAWAALFCLGITFTDDCQKFLEFLESTERFDLLKVYQQETLF